MPRPSGFLEIPADPCLPNPAGSAFQTLQVFNDLAGLPSYPTDPVRTDDVQLHFLQATIPADPIHPPGFRLGVSSDAVDVTPPGGTVAIFSPGPHGFYHLEYPGDPILPGDPITPQTLHFSFSAHFIDQLVSPGSELLPADPIFVLEPLGQELNIDAMVPLAGTGGAAVQLTRFAIDLNPALSGAQLRITDPIVTRGSVDIAFDVTVGNPQVLNAVPGGTDLLTFTTTANLVPEPAGMLIVVGALVLLKRPSE